MTARSRRLVRRMILPATGALLVLFLALASADNPSETRAFRIDGKRFAIREGSIVAMRSYAPDVSCPKGLDVDHSLMLERGDGATSLAFGRKDVRSCPIGTILANRGWKRRGHTGPTTVPHIYVKRGDKERSIVFVDENTGDYLFLRQTGK